MGDAVQAMISKLGSGYNNQQQYRGNFSRASACGVNGQHRVSSMSPRKPERPPPPQFNKEVDNNKTGVRYTPTIIKPPKPEEPNPLSLSDKVQHSKDGTQTSPYRQSSHELQLQRTRPLPPIAQKPSAASYSRIGVQLPDMQAQSTPITQQHKTQPTTMRPSSNSLAVQPPPLPPKKVTPPPRPTPRTPLITFDNKPTQTQHCDHDSRQSSHPKSYITLRLPFLALSIPSKYDTTVVNLCNGTASLPQPETDLTPVAPDRDCLHCHAFQEVDSHAANPKFHRGTVTSVQTLASELTSPFPAQVEKARAIFIWLHHNVDYDTVSFFGNSVQRKTPEDTLRSGLAVCQGYAELFQALGKHCGLEVVVVTGYGKGYGYVHSDRNIHPFNANHAWNAVRLEKGWRLMDACWGAGHLNSQNQYVRMLNTKYFAADPEAFRIGHFPTNTKFQMCTHPMRWDEYMSISKPLTYTSFDQLGFNESTIKPGHNFLRADDTTFTITTRCEHRGIPPRDRYLLLLSVNSTYIPFQVNAKGTVWTCEARPRSGYQCGEIQVVALDTFGEKCGKGLTLEEYNRKKGTVGFSFQGLCKWELADVH